MLRIILSTVLLFGLVGCSVEDEINKLSCTTLKVNAGSDKSVTINEEVVISGAVTKASGEISEYEWKKETETLSTSSSFSYIPTTVGNQVLTFSVKDENGCEASDNMTLTVNPLDNTEDNSQAVDDNTEDDTQDVDNTQTQQNFNGKYTWTNGELKATVTSLKKTNNLITLRVVYKNISSEDIFLRLFSYSTRLLDENGAIWDFKEEDSAGFSYPGRTIMPSKKIITDIKFKARNSINGTVFDFIGEALNDDEFNHRILGIPVNLGN